MDRSQRNGAIMTPPGPYYWRDGAALTSSANAANSPQTALTSRPIARGFWVGEAIYETLLVRVGRVNPPALWRLHRRRFFDGAQTFGLPWPGDGEVDRQLATVLSSLSTHTAAIAAQAHGWWRVRLTLAATGPISLLEAPTTASLWIEARPAITRIRPPARLTIGPRLRNQADPLCRTKRISLASDLMALRHARDQGWDDVVLLDQGGRLSEASTSALIFGLPDGSLGTPAVDTAPLPSTTLQLLELAGHSIRPLRWQPGAAQQATWAVMLNAIQGARPVLSLDTMTFSEPPAAFIAQVRACVDAENA